MAAYCLVTGVPSHALLGDLESVLLPVCSERILAIEVQDSNALVQFESERDADACVGETRLLDNTVVIDRHDSSTLTPAAARPTIRRAKAQDKGEREQRLNRVGLSYRCGRCGQPKKGHVCPMGEGDSPASAATGTPAQATPPSGTAMTTPVAMATGGTPAAASASGSSAPPSGARGPGWDLGSDAIFKDMNSVITKSGGKEAKGGSGGKGKKAAEKAAEPPKAEPRKSARKAEAEEKAAAANAPAAAKKAPRSRPKAANSKNCPPPSPPSGVDGKSHLYAEIDLAMHRPPSVITPEESDGRPMAGLTTGGSIGGFSPSPGALMYQLLGTPTPQLPSVGTALGQSMLSPGTLNELGCMLQSPQLPSAKAAAESSPAGGGLGSAGKRRRDGEGGGKQPTRSSPRQAH